MSITSYRQFPVHLRPLRLRKKRLIIHDQPLRCSYPSGQKESIPLLFLHPYPVVCMAVERLP